MVADFAVININQVRNLLKRIKRNRQRQNHRGWRKGNARHGCKIFNKKACVLEIAEQSKVRRYPESEKAFRTAVDQHAPSVIKKNRRKNHGKKDRIPQTVKKEGGKNQPGDGPCVATAAADQEKARCRYRKKEQNERIGIKKHGEQASSCPMNIPSSG
ncbi:MAG: hypothetical protein BWX99_02571 [Deltaproteobacteria bacterium ADurb.Bin151]|nr:MAG: hypothetical protein BWX99_02571 [Deltaproteobacteria bacterium ADurb.Bin151]